MILLDANYILRYLLQDNQEMFVEAKKVIGQENCFLLNEVLAEVVYVLEGVYKTPKKVIEETLSTFVQLHNIHMYESKETLAEALKIYKTKNLDYVDCCLCALREKYEVKTFDKKLLKCIERP